MADELPRAERLAVDVDARLVDLWMVAWDRETLIGNLMHQSNDLAETVGSLLRAAYGLGYCDALGEDREGRRGELARTHGYQPL